MSEHCGGERIQANSGPQNRINETETGSGVADPWARQVVLSLDGGGIRGLSELYVLKEIMAEIAVLERDHDHTAKSSAASPLTRLLDSEQNTEAHSGPDHHMNVCGLHRIGKKEGAYLPCHYFDYIAGTSTGGIIAVLLGRLRFTVDEAIDHYRSIWEKMGGQLSLYDRISPLRKAKTKNTAGLQSALGKILKTRRNRLNEHFECHCDDPQLLSDYVQHDNTVDDSFESDAKMCRTLALAVEINFSQGVQRPYLFRSYPFPNERATAVNRRPRDDIKRIDILDVCRATSAAPQYFESMRFDGINDSKFRDGSLWTTNPSMELYREVRSMHPETKHPIGHMVSIGCGQQKRSQLRHSLPGWKGGSSPSNTEQWGVDAILNDKGKDKLEFEYQRFSGPSDILDLKLNDWKLDSSGDLAFKRIETAAQAYCNRREVRDEIGRCAELLVSRRQQRAKTTHWERFALGMYYKCKLCKQIGIDPPEYDDRNDFIEHLQRKHEKPPQDKSNWNLIQGILWTNAGTKVK